ncbi:MAG: IS110 family transposase [Sulfitobacter sp.]|nr:IS110 family transposase [Sulfitobacter sp.]
MYYGLDLHWKFIQVCALDGRGQEKQSFKLATTHEAITAFGKTLGPQDQVVIEATFHSWAIWALLEGQAGKVVVANPLQVKAIAHARIKTDKVDARVLAQLLRADFIPEVQMPEHKTWELRQLVTHRQLLARQKTAVRNAVHGILHRKLLRCPHQEAFSPKGRRWMREQSYTDTERFILDNTLAQLDELEKRLKAVNDRLRSIASTEHQARLLMTIPGIDVTVAIGLIASIGDITRFDSPGKLASYFGLVPRVKQSADKCFHGPITKAGRSSARWLAVEAAQSLSQASSPLCATYHRVKRKKCHNVAVTALARKLVELCWHLLTKNEPYRYAPVQRTRHKLRRVTPKIKPAKRGQVPKTLEGVYAEVGLPELDTASDGERRAAANNRRSMTMLKKNSATKKAGRDTKNGSSSKRAKRT